MPTRTRYETASIADREIAVIIQGPKGTPIAERAWIVRDGLLWKNASLVGRSERIVATGAAAIHAELKRMTDDAPRMVLPLHEGYWGVYDGDELPFGRIMRVEGGWRFRRLMRHEAVTTGTFDEAVEIAYKTNA